MKVSELAPIIVGFGAQLDKVQAEILGKFAALEEALANMDKELPPDAVEALSELGGSIQALDEIVPDAIVDPVIDPTE